jgi:sterol 3beta-glucosyltransferase
VKLGVSPVTIPRDKLTVDALAAAIIRAVEDQEIRQNAMILGEKIRNENGVKNAVEIINKTLKK